MPLRVSSNDLIKKLLRQILESDSDEMALMAENLLGVNAVYDHTEFCEWEITPIPDMYGGAFDADLPKAQQLPT